MIVASHLSVIDHAGELLLNSVADWHATWHGKKKIALLLDEICCSINNLQYGAVLFLFKCEISEIYFL